jgi:hypothetical protein
MSDGTRSDIAWTDDGKTWNSTMLDPLNRAGSLAVSRDGRTIVATSTEGAGAAEPVVTMKLSTDAGAHWRKVPQGNLWGREAGPVAFNNGTALLTAVAFTGGKDVRGLYTIGSDGIRRPPLAAPDLIDLSTAGDLAFGPLGKTGPSRTKVATSTDHGRTWQSFEPR